MDGITLKPDALDAFLDSLDLAAPENVALAGRVALAVKGRGKELGKPLDAKERSIVAMIVRDGERMADAIAKERERKAAYRKAKARDESGRNGEKNGENDIKDEASQGQNAPSGMSQGQDGMSQGQNGRRRLSHPTYLPTTLPTYHPTSLPTSLPTSRSVNVPLTLTARGDAGTERNVNGTADEVPVKGGLAEARRLAARAAEAVARDEGAFFDGRHDAVSLILALTADYGSVARWRQLVRAKGEAAVCEELFAFYREIRAGEDCENRAAALNARLAKMPDAAKEPPESHQERPEGGGQGNHPAGRADAPEGRSRAVCAKG